MRYEELVSEPAKACEALCAFLGLLSMTPCYDSTRDGRGGPRPRRKKAWRPVTAGLRVWESEMSAEEVERFEAAGGDLLDELGYPRTILLSVTTDARGDFEGSRLVHRGSPLSTPPASGAMVNPYVFIVGGTRSGTTLLQRMVDAHPDLAVIHETHWIPRFYEERIGLTPGGMVTTELVAKLLDDRRFGKLGIAREDLEGLIPRDRPISYADYVTRIFDLYGEARGKRSVGRKPRAT